MVQVLDNFSLHHVICVVICRMAASHETCILSQSCILLTDSSPFITSPCVLQSSQGSPLSSTSVFWNEDAERSCYEVPTQCSFSMCLLTLSLFPQFFASLACQIAFPAIQYQFHILALRVAPSGGFAFV